MLKAFKYRIYPTDIQKSRLDQHFAACRMLWNLALEVKKTAWSGMQKNVSRIDLQAQLVELKQEYKWLYEVNSQSLQSTLLHLDNSFKRFFNGSTYPKFKKKRGLQKFQCPQHCALKNGMLKLPKIGKLDIVISRPFIGIVKTVTISKTPTGKYFASVLSQDDSVFPVKPRMAAATTIGIDIGVKSFIVTSDGRTFAPNQKLKESLKRLQCLQRRASRKQKGGKNWAKAKKRVALIHEKISNQRADYIHKITTQLIRDNQAESFVIENLNVVGMVKNNKLARVISDASFGEFSRQMRYKCDWYGKNLIMIDRFAPSSKRCSECGSINQELTLADREWSCGCGSRHDRDFNAAKNIRYYGLLKHSGEGVPGEPVESPAIAGALKQELITKTIYS